MTITLDVSDDLRAILAAARREAGARRQPQVEPAHLFPGLLQVMDGRGAVALQRARDAVAASLPEVDPAAECPPELPLSTAAIAVLRRTLDDTAHGPVGAGQLLSALRSLDARVAAALREAGEDR